jgi:murein DD-endopeptidase MepM/ murein hydrolase activator NlpD
MALLPPVAVAPQRPFGSSILADYPYWHIGTETAMFGRYTGSVYQSHFHAGLDFPAPENTPIVAPEAGIVKYAGYAVSGSAFDGGGNIVHIFIAGGMHVVSCHMNYPPLVKSGQTVKRGQRIGYVGHTGNAFGNHDHFAIFTSTASGASLFRNPAHYLPGGKYANSALILPPHIPDTNTEDEMLAWVNKVTPVTSPPSIKKVTLKKGQPIRNQPVLSGSTVTNTLSQDTVINVHSKVKGDPYLGDYTWFVYTLNGGGLRVFNRKQI